MNPQIVEKLDLVKRKLLSTYGDNIRCIFAMGSIIHEGTKASDLDVAVVFEDSYFTESITELRKDLRTISEQINSVAHEYPLVLWASKVDHYSTVLPDVSYVRANLPYCFDSLDAWSGLAKHTLRLYERAAHIGIHGNTSSLFIAGQKVPAWESVELFLLATRTLAQGLAEIQDKQEHMQRRGVNHLAKAGLRACYSVMLVEGISSPPTYCAIRDFAEQMFPAPFASIVNDLYLAKTGEKADVDCARLLSLMRHCENQIASVKRLTLLGVAPGRAGESFAFDADSLINAGKRLVSPSGYSRYAGPSINFIHAQYFLASASEIVRRFAQADVVDGNCLDFYFEELVLAFSLATTLPGQLRLILGREESETIEFVYDYDFRQHATKLLVALGTFYSQSAASDEPWLPERRKRALIGILLDAEETALPGSESAFSALVEQKTRIDDLVDAFSWYIRSFEGVFGWHSIAMIARTGRLLYESGKYSAALDVFERLTPLLSLRQNPGDLEFITAQWAQADKDLLLKLTDTELSKALLWHAATLSRLGNIEDAKSNFLLALQYDRDNVSAISGLTNLLVEHSPSPTSVSEIEECLRGLASDSDEARLRVSTSYMRRAVELKNARRWVEARGWYDKALVMDPSNAVIHHNLSILQREAGDIEDAKKSLRRAIELDPDYLNAYVNLALLYESSDLNTAISLLTTAHNRGLGDEKSHANLGNCYYRLSELALAEQQFHEALGISSTHADALNGMGIICLLRAMEKEPAKIHDALGYFEAAVAADPAFSGAQLNYQRAQILSRKMSESTPTERQRIGHRVQSPQSAIMELVFKLDEIRHLTGSFMCSGRTESELVELTDRILSTSSYREVMISSFLQAGLKPTDDLILRSNLVGVPREPKSMDSVFVPRDQARSDFFLPYLLYAIGKLEMNLQSPQVQQELRKMGYDPSSVRQSPLVQVVAGARDRFGAIGRENTISFSAEVSLIPLAIRCNFVFGLPLLATRPTWNGVFQPQTLTIREFGLKSLKSTDELNARQEMFLWESDKNHLSEFSQTHQAVLIPERGIVYEALRSIELRTTNKIEPQGFIILAEDELEDVLRLLLSAALSLNRGSSSPEDHRIDGVLIFQGGILRKPSLVGAVPIRMRQ